MNIRLSRGNDNEYETNIFSPYVLRRYVRRVYVCSTSSVEEQEQKTEEPPYLTPYPTPRPSILAIC